MDELSDDIGLVAPFAGFHPANVCPIGCPSLCNPTNLVALRWLLGVKKGIEVEAH
jgi:hypothetical protein